MIDPELDLDRLGDLWRQQPTEDELNGLKRSAETVRRRARRWQWMEIVFALAVAGVVIALVLTNPEMDILIAGAAAIFILLLGHQRNRRLRAEELRALSGSAEQMLDQSIARAKATLKRTHFQLIGLVPSFLLGLGIAALADRRSGSLAAQIIANPQQGLVIAALAVAVMILVALAFARSIRRTRAELARLVQARDSFRKD